MKPCLNRLLNIGRSVPHRALRGARRPFGVLASIGLLAAALAPSARADFVIETDHFDWSASSVYTLNGTGTALLANTNGTGTGFNLNAMLGGNIQRCAIIESNSLLILRQSGDAGNRESVTANDGAAIGPLGTKFEFKGVKFAWDTASPFNSTGQRDQMYLGVQAVSGANDDANGAGQSGVFLQIMGNSMTNYISGKNYGQGGANATCLLWCQTNSSTAQNTAGRFGLAAFKLDNLNWSGVWTYYDSTNAWQYFATNNPTVTNFFNFNPVLNITLTISNSGWRLQIAGDTTGSGTPIDLSGTWPSGYPPPTTGYAHVFNQTENPAVDVSVDQVNTTVIGNFVLPTPTYYLPDYPYTTNQIRAGERVLLVATNAIQSINPIASVQWQVSDTVQQDTFHNIAGATTTSWSLDTSAATYAALGYRLAVTDNKGNVGYTPTTVLGIFGGVPPTVVNDTAPMYPTRYTNASVQFSASFTGNLPIWYQWQSSANGYDWSPVPGVGNTNVMILSHLSPTNAIFYRLYATNNCSLSFGGGEGSSTPSLITILAAVPQIAWRDPVPWSGQTKNQIITNTAGWYIAGAGKVYPGRQTVTLSDGTPVVFTYKDWNWIASGGSSDDQGRNNNAAAPTTGDGILDGVLSSYEPNTNGPGIEEVILVSNLIVGKQYCLQLFANNNRTGLTPVNADVWVYYENNLDDADQSFLFSMASDQYVTGVFTATNSYQNISMLSLTNLNGTNAGNFNAVVVRAVGWVPGLYALVNPTNTAAYVGYLAKFYTAVPGAYMAVTNAWKAGPPGGPYTNLVAGAKYAFSGANNIQLTIKNVAAADANLAYVVVWGTTNGATVVTSPEARLSIRVGTPQIVWSDPVSWTNPVALNKDQILTNTPGRISAAITFNATSGWPNGNTATATRWHVTNGLDGSWIEFSTTNSGGWLTTLMGANAGAQNGLFDTGDANFNTVLNMFADNNNPKTLLLTNMVVGQTYSVQMFTVDNRSYGAGRYLQYLIQNSGAANTADPSPIVWEQANAYVVGTFVATNSIMYFQVNGVPDITQGNLNAVIVRGIGFTPPLYSVQPVASGGGYLGYGAMMSNNFPGTPMPCTNVWQAGPAGGPYTNLSLTSGRYVGVTNSLTLTIIGASVGDQAIRYVTTWGTTDGLQTATAPEGSLTVTNWAWPGTSNILGYLGYAATFTNQTTLPGTSIPVTNTWMAGPPNGPYTNLVGARYVGVNSNIMTMLNLTADDTNNVRYVVQWGTSNGVTTISPELTLILTNWTWPGSSNVSGYFGYAATLTNGGVFPGGSSPVTNIWKAGPPGGPYTVLAGSKYYGVTGTRLQITIPGAADTNNIRYVVTWGTTDGLYTATSPELNLTLSGWSWPNANISTFAGVPLTLTCLGTLPGGYVPVSNIWQSGSPGGPYASLPYNSKYYGPASTALVINNVQTADAAYRYVVKWGTTDGLWTASSPELAITVLTPAGVTTSGKLIGQWLSGTADLQDHSGNAPAGTHDGFMTSTNNAYWTNDVPPGKGGYSLYFKSGNSDSGMIISNSWNGPAGTRGISTYRSTFDDPTNALSVSCWARVYPQTIWYAWVSKRGEDSYGFQLRRGNGNNISWTIRGTASGGGDLQNGTTDDGQWHYYTGVYDSQAGSGQQRLYRDGVLMTSQNATGGIRMFDGSALSFRLGIGTRENSTHNGFEYYYGPGAIYDVRIYNYPLSQMEIDRLSGKPQSFSATVTNKSLVLNFGSSSFLVSSTNLLKGPWVTNYVQSPYTVVPDRTAPPTYYRSQGW